MGGPNGNIRTLEHHIQQVASGNRVFENVFQSLSRMILGDPDMVEKVDPDMVEKVNVCGQTTYNYKALRRGGKPVVGMYFEINSLVNFIKDAADGGSSKEMAFVLVGEPGNGKTFLVETLCSIYRDFLSEERNRIYTFRFNGLDEALGYSQKVATIESQTYEDPMILAMNLFSRQASIEFLESQGISEKQLDLFLRNYRPLGACTDYIMNQLQERFNGDVNELLRHVEVIPVPLSPALGTVTGKYTAKDKITSSSVDLLGEEDVGRLLFVTDANHPYRLNLRRGALARVAARGIHFADELFKNKPDLIQVYLGVIQNRSIEIDGFRWPMDTFIIATSNNDEYAEFANQQKQAPIIDRCRRCDVAHNTDYNLQGQLTAYVLGSDTKQTVTLAPLHEDPNLNYAASVAVVLTRLPHNADIAKDKLTPVEMMKLAAGEVAGDKSIKTLAEVIDGLNHDPDITKRFGQKGVGQRGEGKAVQILGESSGTNEGQCMFAGDFFRALEQVVLDTVLDERERAKYLGDIELARGLYREKVVTALFNAYMDDPEGITKDVLNYVNMVVGTASETLGKERIWRWTDPQTKKMKAIKIDDTFINSVESRLGLTTAEKRESFRTSIRKIHGQKMVTDPNYNFMDNNDLVRAVTDVRLNSDIGTAGSLSGALANRTNETNQKLYDRIMSTMVNKLGYCATCAEKTIEMYCSKDNTN